MNKFWFMGVSLAPLLGASRTLQQAGAIALCAVLLMTLHQALLAPLRRHLIGLAGLVASILLVGALASCLQMALRAWALPLALDLGHYPALLALACLTADVHLPVHARWRWLAVHLSAFVTLCLVLGATRQWLANSAGLHLANLAPGALILLGVLLALYNLLRPGPAPSRRNGNR